MSLVCQFCKQKDIKLLGVVYDPLNIQNKKEQVSFELWQCDTCNIRYKKEYYSDAELNQFYTNLPTNNWPSKITKPIEKLFKKRVEIINHYLPSGDIIDIGCFNGTFLEFIGNTYTRYGLEPSDIMLPKGINKINSSLEEYESKGKTYQLATLFDVMEHIKDPYIFLKKVDIIIAKKGYIMIDTGDFSSLNASLFGIEWGYYSIIGHCTFYNKKTFKHILGILGYKIIEFRKTDRRGFKPKLFILAIIYKLFKIIAKYTYLYKISFFKKYYFHTPPIFLYKDHCLIFAQKQ